MRARQLRRPFMGPLAAQCCSSTPRDTDTPAKKKKETSVISCVGEQHPSLAVQIGLRREGVTPTRGQCAPKSAVSWSTAPFSAIGAREAQ